MTLSRRWEFDRGVLQLQRGRARDIGSDTRWGALRATVVGNQEAPSGESRMGKVQALTTVGGYAAYAGGRHHEYCVDTKI